MKQFLLLLCITVSIVPTMLHAEPEIKGTPSDLTQFISTIPKTVFVTGQSEVRLAAARAIVSLTVVTENKSLSEALRFNAEICSKVRSELKRQGIAPEKIQGSRFSSTPKFGIWGDKAKSYRVENVLRVSVQDEKEFRSAAKAVDSIAEVNFSGVEFEYNDQETAKAKAIAEACDNAESRKKVYEEHLGIKLTSKRFTEGAIAANEPAPQPMKPDYYERSRASSPSTSVEESTSSFGEIVFKASVSVEYQADSK
jgi:uncharacterized protein YggE